MKKVFISADIEGITDVVSWGETVPDGHNTRSRVDRCLWRSRRHAGELLPRGRRR